MAVAEINYAFWLNIPNAWQFCLTSFTRAHQFLGGATPVQTLQMHRMVEKKTPMGGSFDEEFDDVGVSGATLALKRPGFAKLLAFIKKSSTFHVYAIDRLVTGLAQPEE